VITVGSEEERALELQDEIRPNESVAGTLVDDRPTVGIANMVATAAIQQRQPSGAGSATATPSGSD